MFPSSSSSSSSSGRGDLPWLWLPSSEPVLAEARRAAALGAYDTIARDRSGPPDALALLISRLEELAAGEEPLPEAPQLVLESAAARRMVRQVARAAATRVPVLLVGETGTGKEEMATHLHLWSGRKGPWLPINCAAIPNELMESELFGHARGAFSGAVASVDGKLLAAQGGTVFLDEIDDTPLSVQMKLLRVLEDGAVTRVGETKPRATDFRLVAATNREPIELVASGEFGRDFYERLAIVRIDLPPLRERREDLPRLARHFIERFYQLHPERRPRVEAIDARALAALLEHPWPGNLRELRNVVFHALVEKRAGTEILLSDLPRLVRGERTGSTDTGIVDAGRVRRAVAAGAFNLKRERERLERVALEAALEAADGSVTAAAHALGEVGRGTSHDPGATVRAMRKRLGV